MPATDPRPETLAPDSELAFALERGLAAPLRAVEVALAGLVGELNAAAGQRFEGPRVALAEVLREAEAAVDLFAQRPLRRDLCTLRELAWGARSALPAALRERVWVATEPGGPTIETDAPTLVRALAALLARAIDGAGAEVLLHAHQEDGQATFAVVDDLEAGGDVFCQGPPLSPTPALLLARADLARLGADLAEHVAGPHRCITVHLRAGGRP